MNDIGQLIMLWSIITALWLEQETNYIVVFYVIMFWLIIIIFEDVFFRLIGIIKNEVLKKCLK